MGIETEPRYRVTVASDDCGVHPFVVDGQRTNTVVVDGGGLERVLADARLLDVDITVEAVEGDG